MMNWSSELLKQAKGKNRRKFKKSEQDESEEHQRGKEDRATCTEEDGTGESYQSNSPIHLQT